MGLNVCFHSTCIYDEIGGQLSEIGAAFSGSFSDSDSDSEIATQQNDYRGSFRLQTLGRQVRVMSLWVMVVCNLASYTIFATTNLNGIQVNKMQETV